MFSATFLLTALASLAQLAFAAPTDGRSTRLIVTLKDGIVPAQVVRQYARTAILPIEELTVINGFIVDSTDASLDDLKDDPNVESVEEDSVVSVQQDGDGSTQTDAPWGLARLYFRSKLSNQNAGKYNFEYGYHPTAGEGVDVYVLDTGVRITHTEFEGRASWGATFGGYADADGNGHGTHCAGTIAGHRYGVAKKANIIAVKVLSDGGKGNVGDVIEGMNYVYNRVQSTGRPSVVSMSLGGGRSGGMDAAVQSLTAAGIHVVVAAGNENEDASNHSPARAPSAITVGATNIADKRASFSNFGPGVDIFAPGVKIKSAWKKSDTDTKRISGTSMAAPHVAGLVAHTIAWKGNRSPEKMSTTLKSWSEKNRLKRIPDDTHNRLAHNRPSLLRFD